MDNPRTVAALAGACAALEERKLDANPYPEDSELNFCWLYGFSIGEGMSFSLEQLRYRGGRAPSLFSEQP